METKPEPLWNKALDILVTALISAGIAFLQTLLATHGHSATDPNTATVAGTVAVAIRTIKIV